MKPSTPQNGGISEEFAALFQRLDDALKRSSTAFEAAPFMSLVLEHLARGMRPNELLAWRSGPGGGGVDDYYRALLEAYLDHLVHAEVESEDVQWVNQLFQDILDGNEPDRVLGYAANSSEDETGASRSKQVVFAFRMIIELENGADPGLVGGDEGRDMHADAVARVAAQCGVPPAVVAQAYADVGIRAEARRLVDLQGGLTAEMERAAARELRARKAQADDERVSEYTRAWWALYRDGE